MHQTFVIGVVCVVESGRDESFAVVYTLVVFWDLFGLKTESEHEICEGLHDDFWSVLKSRPKLIKVDQSTPGTLPSPTVIYRHYSNLYNNIPTLT